MIKAGKKLLSVLLCLTMLLTSISVCFTSFAAMSAGSITKLAEALKSETVKNLKYDISNRTNVKDSNNKSSIINTTTITLGTYAEYAEMLNVLTLINNAVEATNEYKKYNTYNSSDNGDVRNCSNPLLVKNEILDSLRNADDMTDAQIAEYHVDVLFDNIFSMKNVSYYHGADECYSNKDKGNLYERVHDYTIIKTDDYQGYLASLDSRDQISDTVQLGAKLAFTMCRQNYVTGNIVTTNHYHYAFNNETEDAKEFTVTDVNTNNTVRSTVDGYAEYIDSITERDLTFGDMLAMVQNGTMSGANGFETDFNSRSSSITSYVGGESVFKKLYSDKLDAIEQIRKDIESAKNFDTYEAIAAEYNSYAAAHPNYGVYSYGAFDYDKMTADYNEFLGIYYKLTAGGRKLVIYLAEENMIDLGYYYNFTDNVTAFDLAVTAEAANTLYSDSKDTYADMTTEEQEAVLSLLTGYINAIESYSAQVQRTFFPNGHEYLVELSTALNCKVNASVVFFVANTKATLLSANTQQIIKVISGVDENKSALGDFYNNIKAATSENKANELLGDAVSASNTLKDDLYALLAERFTGEVEAARRLYSDLGEPEIVNAKTAAKLGAVFAELDDDGGVIYNYLSDEGKLGLVSAETIEKYNYINNKVLEKYKEYLRTFGLGSYEQTAFGDNGVYAVREPYAGDLIKTEDYIVTEENLEGIIDSLDIFLNSDSFKDLIGGKGIDEIIMSLVDRLYTDDVVNLIVQYAYPLVANEILNIWDTLPSSIKITVENVVGSIDVDVDAGLDIMSVENATETLGLYLFPQTLARHISAEDYPDVVQKLASVKTAASADNNPWDSKLIHNDDGKLNLKWGVTDKESFLKAIDAALTGIEPLLMTLLANRELNLSGDIGSGSGSATVLGIHVKIVVSPLTINLNASGNEGYNNAIAPMLEALGLTAPDGNSFTTVSALLDEGVLAPVTELITRFANAPVDTLLSVLPNLVYGLSSNMIQALLKMLKTEISYVASADYDAGVTKGHIDEAMTSGDEPISINIGEMLDIESLIGLRLSNINALIKKIGLDIPEIDVGAIATCGKLTTSSGTVRNDWIYAHSYIFDADGNELPITDEAVKAVINAKKAYTIETNKADLAYYIISYTAQLLNDRESVDNIISFISGFVVNRSDYTDDYGQLDQNAYDAAVKKQSEDISKTVDEIFKFIDLNDKDDVIAAVVEFFNPVENYRPIEPDWADGSLSGSAIPYLKYNNDWNREKANDVLDNIDDLLSDILRMTGSEKDSINEIIQDAISSIFTNKTITDFVEALIKLGYTVTDKTVITLIRNELGIDLRTWAASFGDMLPEFTAKCVDELLENGKDIPDFSGVPTLSSVTYNDGVWSVNGKVFTDSDRFVFIDLVTEIIKPFAKFASVLLAGEDISVFNGAVIFKGYDNYANSVGILFEAIGAGQVDYKSDVEKYGAEVALGNTVKAFVAGIDDILEGNMIKNIAERLSGIVYFIESDGISAVLHNLFMPILALADNIRPIMDIDLNKIVSFLISDVLESVSESLNNGNEIKISIDTDSLIEIISGENVYTKYSIDLEDLDLAAVLRTADIFLGTNLIQSKLYEYGIPSLCSGKTEVTNSVTGVKSYTSKIDAADTLSILVSSVVDALKDTVSGSSLTNGDIICEFIQKFIKDSDIDVKMIYNAILSLLDGLEISSYAAPDWAYMYDGENALQMLDMYGLPARTGENSIIYTNYTNNWNDATATLLNDNLKSIVTDIVKGAHGNDTTIGVMLDAAITGGIYKDEVLCKVLEAVIKAVANIDDSIINIAGALLNIDFDQWVDICKITRDENGKVTDVECIKDWGIDSKTTNEEKKQAFVAAFTDTLKPLNRVLAWLFFESDYTFLNSADGSDLITISGGRGFDFGIVPILEAIDCGEVKSSSAFYKNGAYDISEALGYVLTSICDKLSEMCGDDTLGVMLEMLPNVVYFINAGGVSSCVNNILEPVTAILESLTPVVGQICLDDVLGFPISDVSFNTIFDILSDTVGLNFKETGKSFAESFYMGKVESYTSANGAKAYRMTYSDTETRREMITILLSLGLENIKYDKNQEILKKWFGEDIYKSIINILNITSTKAMQEFSWYNTEYADTDKTFTGIETSNRYTVSYNEYWTKDKAMYMAENLPDFVDFVIKLLDVKVGETQVTDINTLLDTAITDNLCTQKNADKFIALLRDLTGKLTQLEPYGEYIGQILNTSLGFDINAWDNMEVSVENGNMESFADAVTQIVAPAVPLFKVMLAGESVSFLVGTDGTDLVKIPGSEGYAYGIIPFLEALGCENILTPAEFKALLAEDEYAAIRAVIDPVIDRINFITQDPVNNILNMLPAVIYFINSNGIDTCVKNIVNAADNLLAALEPIIGETDICTLAGIDLSTYDFEWIVNFAMEKIEESTGYNLSSIDMDAVAEFTVGKVVSYSSVNGEKYYTMQYASELDKADMVTILLRVALEFITEENNLENIEGYLADQIENQSNYKAACALLEAFARSVRNDPDMTRALFVIYYVFHGINEEIIETGDVELDTNDLWKKVIKVLDNSTVTIIKDFSSNLRERLKNYFGNIFDRDNNSKSFFQRLLDFFRRIIEFFKNLFKR